MKLTSPIYNGDSEAIDFLELDDIIVNQFNNENENLIMILQAIQRRYNYLPQPALKYLSEKMSVPLAQIYGVGTFYSTFSLEPRGNNLISVCLGTACRLAADLRRLGPGDRLGGRAGAVVAWFCPVADLSALGGRSVGGYLWGADAAATGGTPADSLGGRGLGGTGDYRWAATILNHLVFADPTNETGRTMLASTYEQLGFQSESIIWRNIYLCGAKELREGIKTRKGVGGVNEDIVRAMPVSDFFNLLAVKLDPDKAKSAVAPLVP